MKILGKQIWDFGKKLIRWKLKVKFTYLIWYGNNLYYFKAIYSLYTFRWAKEILQVNRRPEKAVSELQDKYGIIFPI